MNSTRYVNVCLLLLCLAQSAAFHCPTRGVRFSRTRPLPLWASEKKEINPYDLLSTIGQTGFVPVSLINRFAKKTITAGYTSNLSMLFALFGTLDVLGSALKRKRLDGTTFKYLNLGVLLSTVIYMYKSLQGGGVTLSTKAFTEGIAFILMIASGAVSASKLQTHGLPNPKKLKMKGEKGYCPFSSNLYLVALVTSYSHALRALLRGTTSWGTALGLAYSSISTGLVPLVLLVEHQATLAKRLNSRTYKDLNWMLVLVSGVGILTAPYGTFRISSLSSLSLDKGLFLISTLSGLCASLLGLQIGYTTQETK